MSITLRIHQHIEDEVDFIDALIQTDAENVAWGHPLIEEIAAIRDSIIENNAKCCELCELKPEQADRYLAQRDAELVKFETRLREMRIPGVT